MKGLICIEPTRIEEVNLPEPVMESGEVLLEIKRVGICGTDLHAYEGTQPYFTYPRILGHEIAARVVDSADHHFTRGEEVTVIPYFHCGNCIACRNGLTNCCSSLKVFGVHIDGGMRQRVVLPANYLVKAGGLTTDQLALVEPLAIGAHAVRRAGIHNNDTVLVMGAGPIGMAIIQFASLTGARVLVMDMDGFRLEFCQTYLGTAELINASEVNAVDQVNQLTNREGCTVVVDATGNLKAINSGLEYLSHGGRFVLVGLQKNAFSFSHPDFHKRETTLMSSRNATAADFDWVMQCIRNNRINPLPMINFRVSADQLKNQFDLLLKPGNNLVKAMMEW